MVGIVALNHAILVRIQARQLKMDMKITFKNDPVIPDGEYELTDERSKLVRAKEDKKDGVGIGATDREIFLAYDRLGGRIVDKDGKPSSPQYFWNLYKIYMSRQIEQWSDTELLYVKRRGEDFVITRDFYQVVSNELEIRHQQKMVGASRQNRSGISFKVDGDMINHGVIQNAKSSTINITSANKTFFETWHGKIILGVSITLIATFLAYKLGWQ